MGIGRAKQQPKERSVEEVQKRVAVHHHGQSKIALVLTSVCF
jgi:hypothetical protein